MIQYTNDGFPYPSGATRVEVAPSSEKLGTFDILPTMDSQSGALTWVHDFAVPAWEVGQLFGGN